MIIQEADQDDLDGELEHPITMRDFRTEVYKDSTGLVYRLHNVVQMCSRPDCVGQGIVQSGRFYREVLINEGNNSETTTTTPTLPFECTYNANRSMKYFVSNFNVSDDSKTTFADTLTCKSNAQCPP